MPQEKTQTAAVTDGKNKRTRKGSLTGDYEPAPGGSHFKAPAAAQTRPGSKAVSGLPLVQSGSHGGGHKSASTGADKASEPALATSDPSVSSTPHRLPKRSKKHASGKAMPYSRYNRRYTELSGAAVALEGPTFSWTPYCIYGGVAVLVILAWCVASHFMTGEAASIMPVVGLVVLCATVVAGIALAVVLAKLTMGSHEELDTVDVLASAVGKSALMMVVAVLIWVLASAIISI